MKVLAFGEILWDIYKTADSITQEIGGAPFNFAAHFSKLGGESHFVSAVGKDKLGELAIKEAIGFGIDIDYIDKVDLTTGYCNVVIDGLTDNATYDLVTNTAYDNIPLPRLKDKYDAFYFGTLAQRGEVSRSTLHNILKSKTSHLTFLDINLRKPFYTKEIVHVSLSHTDILKLSRQESGELMSLLFQSKPSCLEDLAIRLSTEYNIKIVIITLDKDGAMLYEAKESRFLYSKKPTSKVVSPVGAGDSFSAAFLYNYLAGAPLSLCLDRGVALSDYVVTKTKAIPQYPKDLLNRIK